MAKNKIKKKYDGRDLAIKTKHILMNKYYNLYMNSVEFKGLTHEEEDYILRKFWSEGTLCAFALKDYGVVYAPYSVNTYGLYDVPKSLTIINERNVPNFPTLVDNGINCVIGFYNRSHKPVRETIEFYIDRMVELLMSLYVNVQTSKLPFLVNTNGDDTQAINEVIDNIYNNELAIFMSTDVMNSLKVNATGSIQFEAIWTQYLNYESACLTELGIDNNCIQMNRLTSDQTNANNNLINLVDNGRIYEMKEFFEAVYKLFGHRVEVKSKNMLTSSIHDKVGTGKGDNVNE